MHTNRLVYERIFQTCIGLRKLENVVPSSYVQTAMIVYHVFCRFILNTVCLNVCVCVCVCAYSVFGYSLELRLVYLLFSFLHFPHTSSLLADCWFILLRKAALKVTPWNKPHVEKLIVSWLVKIFSAFYGTRRFITVLTAACHMSAL